MNLFPWFLFSMALVEPGLPAEESSSQSDESAIRDIVNRQTGAWNRGDARGYAESFEKDGWFTNILGQVFTGHDEFEQRHATIFATFSKGSRLLQTIRRIRFLGTDVAIVDVDTEMAGFQTLPPGVRAGEDGMLRTRLEQVFRREGKKWRVAAYHNVDVKPLPKHE